MTEDMRKAAEAATPGPWVGFSDKGKLAAIMPAGRPGDVCVFEQPPSDEDGRFMLLANPAAILALYAELDRLREAVQERDDLLDNERGGRAAAIARAEKAEGEITHYRQDTGYVLGWNAGWDEAFGRLKFPTMLRKMWSGGEVQRWLDEQKAEQNGPPDGSLSERLAAAEASLAAVTAERDTLATAIRKLTDQVHPAAE